MKRISLNGTWTLTGRLQTAPHSKQLSLTAEVPGTVALELSRQGYLPEDLYLGNNITQVREFEDYEWWYERTFTAPAERENVFLVFRGVDCLAEYFLNGEKLGESANMFIPFEFDVSDKLTDGENTVTVHLSSPTVYEHSLSTPIQAIGYSFAFGPESIHTRRAAHTYGWDIFPRAVSCGLWRDVTLEIRDPVRFGQAFFDTTNPQKLRFCYEIECPKLDFENMEIEVDCVCGDSAYHTRVPVTYKSGYTEIESPNPKLWWPRDYGEQNLYTATLRIYSHGTLVCQETARFGIRTVKLERSDITDGKKGCFRFLINGEEIMAKGSNWVPLDAFHSRAKERCAKALELVKDIGCNILRSWGGGVYEDHDFFDFCDENGILVWQDFAMACHNYVPTPEFMENFRREATHVVREYRHHPSIILWSGDNEVDEMKAKRGVDPSTNVITRELLPEVVLWNDIGRPYLESSPYVSKESFATGGFVYQPEAHLWGARDNYKSPYYKHSLAHFVSEAGYHGCPSMESIQKFITPEKLWPYQNNDEWILHSSDQKGNDKRVMLMEKQIRQLFGKVPTTPEEYIFASQISQAEAFKYFIERMRVGRPHKSGIIWWNLLDGWPQMSDAVVDYYYEKKLAYGYIQRSQAPFIIAIDEIYNWKSKVFACNDTLTEKTGRVRILDVDTQEILLDTVFAAKANTSTVIGELPLYYSDKKFLVIEWTVDGKTCYNHYLCGEFPFDPEQYRGWLDAYERFGGKLL
ncbi:MAG: glycoside hydrolase family 2 [Clostridia bacterium]|nr:glycoside hydrolase family 2 [Clostridia bacterium]